MPMSTAIKNSGFNVFQWGHFCPKGAERNNFVYLVHKNFKLGSTELSLVSF